MQWDRVHQRWECRQMAGAHTEFTKNLWAPALPWTIDSGAWWRGLSLVKLPRDYQGGWAPVLPELERQSPAVEVEGWLGGWEQGFPGTPIQSAFQERNQEFQEEKHCVGLAVGCDSQVVCLIENRVDHIEGIIFCSLPPSLWGIPKELLSILPWFTWEQTGGGSSHPCASLSDSWELPGRVVALTWESGPQACRCLGLDVIIFSFACEAKYKKGLLHVCVNELRLCVAT